jgi:hypothetical protein
MISFGLYRLQGRYGEAEALLMDCLEAQSVAESASGHIVRGV